MSNYVQDLGADDDFFSIGIPLPIKAPGTVAVAQMQAQANRMVELYIPKLPELPLVIDGIVGAKTTSAIQKMAAIESHGSNPQGKDMPNYTSSSATIKANAGVLTEIINILGNAAGVAPALFAPFLVPPGQPLPPVNAPPGTPGLPPPGMSATTMMIGAVAIGIAWALLAKGSGKGRRKR
jgi:hypothetical protein